ncbi:hypothetical protein ACJIZ3_001940 [Penstemon smallii]|uniref:Ribosomal protein L25 beta domain-containing protein n=1 Tax=Penstemon smallii TaxID=265156 RepID=A0ABD3U882_9LAMI
MMIPLTYLEGFPRPHPKYAEIIPRAASEKERKAGIVFEAEDGQHGGHKRLIFVRLDSGSEEIVERVLPRKVDVPLVFRGDDVSPGLKKGSPLNVINRSVKYLCPLDVGQKIVAGDLKVHPALKLLRSKDDVQDQGCKGFRSKEIQVIQQSTQS